MLLNWDWRKGKGRKSEGMSWSVCPAASVRVCKLWWTCVFETYTWVFCFCAYSWISVGRTAYGLPFNYSTAPSCSLTMHTRLCTYKNTTRTHSKQHTLHLPWGRLDLHCINNSATHISPNTRWYTLIHTLNTKLNTGCLWATDAAETHNDTEGSRK